MGGVWGGGTAALPHEDVIVICLNLIRSNWVEQFVIHFNQISIDKLLILVVSPIAGRVVLVSNPITTQCLATSLNNS